MVLFGRGCGGVRIRDHEQKCENFTMQRLIIFPFLFVSLILGFEHFPFPPVVSVHLGLSGF